jgi:hypothetical protein
MANYYPDVDDNGTDVFSCNSTTSDSYCCYGNCECTDEWETFSFSGTPEDVYTVTIIGDTDFELQTVPPSSVTSAPSSATSTASNQLGGVLTTEFPASPSTSANSTSAPDSSSGSSNSAALGIGVGVGVGVGGAALIAAAAFFFYRRRKRNTPNAYVRDGSAVQPVEAGHTEQGYYPPPTKYAHYEDGASDVKRYLHSECSSRPAS